MELEWGKIMYRFQNQLLPKAFDSYFSRPKHEHNTRYATQNNFEQVRVTSAKEKTLLKVIGPKKWSEIPSDIKNAPYLNTFKALYRTHLMDVNENSSG